MINAEKSEFQVRIVTLGPVVKHPNADRLETTVIDGMTVIMKSGDFREGDKGLYVSVDALVPTARPEFAFLAKEGKTQHRVRAARLRGIFSMGLLVPVPAGLGFFTATQDELMAFLGIEKFIPLAERETGLTNRPPPKVRKGPKLPIYGLDPLRKYESVLLEGETVVITEKIHGCNARYYHDGTRLWVGSHKVLRGATRHRVMEFLNRGWIKLKSLLGIKHRAHTFADLGDIWWEMAEKYDFKNKLAKKPGFVLFGEIYGKGVQTEGIPGGFTYDSPDGRRFRAFDVYDLEAKKYLDYNQFIDFLNEIGLDTVQDKVPAFVVSGWSPALEAEFKKVANTGKSSLHPADKEPHIIEGVVVKPYVEREDPTCGRVALKFAGEGYLLANANGCYPDASDVRGGKPKQK